MKHGQAAPLKVRPQEHLATHGRPERARTTANKPALQVCKQLRRIEAR